MIDNSRDLTPRLTSDDRQTIDELLSAYVLALDIHDIDTAVGLFTEDAEFRTYGRAFVGHDRLRRMFESAPQGLHLCGRSLVSGSPDGGITVRSQLVFYPADRSAHRLSIYDDVVVPVDGRWLFSVRECRFLNNEGVLDVKP